jgi:hypothetical protein
MDGFNYLCDRYPAFLLIIFGAYASLNEVEDSPIFDQADALREYSTIKCTEKKDSRSALLSSRRFLDLTIEKQDDLLRFLTILYLTIADEDAAKAIISLIHLKSTCLDCIAVIRMENIGNKWIPILMDQVNRCSDTDRKLFL